MSSGFSKKIINLSRHSFSEKSNQNDRKTRRFSNINTQAVIYNNEQLQQLYTGLYLDENLHNVGNYRWLTGDDSHRYEGKLFLNNLHGYGKLTYPDDSVYEGLFYFNKKFGPGVITYENNRQDVGIWNGNFLIRLSDKFSVSDYYKECVPRLSAMMQSKLYLLQFRHLIPISEKYNDAAKDVLTKLGAPEKVFANKKILYSTYVRNPNSRFINGEKLYKNFYTYEDELRTTVDVVDHFDENNEPVITKLDVCNLVAWNNEEINTIILKHAFLNRHYEKLLSFNIKDVLCTKRRGYFYPPGPIETKSQELIFACRSADPRQVRRLIVENDLYPDVADCRGNNTVTYATLSNQSKNIKVLSEFGANLNNFNDDCVTPLIFAILHFIAIKYEITSTLWENAFIYAKAENDLPPCNQQWPNPSTSSVTKESFECSQKSVCQLSETSNPSGAQINLVLPKSDEKLSNTMERRDSLTSLLKDYFLTLDCSHTKHTVHIRKTLSPELKLKKSFSSLKVDLSYDKFKYDETKQIMKTILTLLLCGANPNIGEVPFCPIITAIFSRSKDLIQMLITYKAIVNAKTCEYHGKLGPLHVIGSLSPCLEQLEMAYVFLENGAYVDDLTNEIHWLEEQSILLADKNPEDCLQKTPLHLVCMRYDFAEEGKDYLTSLALMFIQYGANLSLQYLGHTPLTLAMMRGNTKLMKNLLDTGLVDPNEGLGYNMGVPLTMCVLNRYSKLLHSSLVKHLYQILTDYYANPFNDVPNFNGNAVEFYYYEHTSQAHARRNSISKSHNGLLLLHCAKSTLLKNIESKVVQILYQYKIICDLDSPLYNIIVKFLTSEKAMNILQILIDYDIIIENSSNIQKLLNFVAKGDPDEKVNLINMENYKKFHFENYMPEIDPNNLKYKVCFECFRKTGKFLILCPKCEMIYFCSQECNIKSIKNPNSGHPCKENFYKKELMNIQANKRRITNYENLLHKSVMLLDLLSSGNIDIKDFSKMKTKDKRKSIGKLKEQQRLDQLNAEDTDKASSRNKTELDDKSSRKKRSRSRKSSSRSASGGRSRRSGKSRKSSRKSRSKSTKSSKSRRSKRSSRGSSSSRKHSRSTSTDFGENKYKKIKVNLKRNVLKGSSSVKDALQVFVGSKKPVIDIDKRNMYLTLRAQMLEKDRERNVRKSTAVQCECCTEKIKMDKNCTKLMLEIAKRKIPNLPKDYEELDVKFWQIFSPYCIFQNGELYYNFKEESNNVYYKITYSNV